MYVTVKILTLNARLKLNVFVRSWSRETKTSTTKFNTSESRERQERSKHIYNSLIQRSAASIYLHIHIQYFNSLRDLNIFKKKSFMKFCF